MSIDKDLLDRLMEGRSLGDLFGKTGILSELMNQTGFTGEQKARKVSYEQRKPREPFFD